WCLVATPFKEDNPTATKGGKLRRVAGEKGLGRLAMARLGTNVEMITKSNNDSAWEVKVDWSELSSETDIAACYAQRRKYTGALPFVEAKTGTVRRIYDLSATWDESKIIDLEENLARLLSPF